MHPRNSYFNKIVRTSTISWLFLFFFLSSQLTSYWFSIDGRLKPIFLLEGVQFASCLWQILNYCGKTCLKRSYEIFPFGLVEI